VRAAVRAVIRSSSPRDAMLTVPGDKSIAHRWLILAATAAGPSRLRGLPPSLDVIATAACLAGVAPGPRASLERWVSAASEVPQRHRFTCDRAREVAEPPVVEVDGEGRTALSRPPAALNCGNSATTMRLLAGVLAAAPFDAVLTGDESLSRRPMARVAEPLRAMGATVDAAGGRPPLRIRGGPLRGIDLRLTVPSAQVKSSVLLAGLAAEGTTTVEEPVGTRDHTERALAALGAPVRRAGRRVEVSAYQHGGVRGTVPGDVSSAAFPVAAAALAGTRVAMAGVGLNPTRTRALDVMRRMGVRVEDAVLEDRVGEPVGELRIEGGATLDSVIVSPEELPLVIDEVPILAVLAANAHGTSRFAGAGELRVKESDRLAGIAEGIRALGGRARLDGDDLVVHGGRLRPGTVDSRGDHRLAMAFAIAAFGIDGAVEVVGMEAAGVSYPGFLDAIRALGASVEGAPGAEAR
jgi:3-phosphoshikimate 1-carboxyvinyltransferase